eukprot:scaffold11906_cov70-Phaeocystis_antarctica.AAC.3
MERALLLLCVSSTCDVELWVGGWLYYPFAGSSRLWPLLLSSHEPHECFTPRLRRITRSRRLEAIHVERTQLYHARGHLAEYLHRPPARGVDLELSTHRRVLEPVQELIAAVHHEVLARRGVAVRAHDPLTLWPVAPHLVAAREAVVAARGREVGEAPQVARQRLAIRLVHAPLRRPLCRRRGVARALRRHVAGGGARASTTRDVRLHRLHGSPPAFGSNYQDSPGSCAFSSTRSGSAVRSDRCTADDKKHLALHARRPRCGAASHELPGAAGRPRRHASHWKGGARARLPERAWAVS